MKNPCRENHKSHNSRYVTDIGEQEGQCTYHVTLRRVHKTIVAVEKQ
jgi:hypothetical protein